MLELPSAFSVKCGTRTATVSGMSPRGWARVGMCSTRDALAGDIEWELGSMETARAMKDGQVR